MNESISPNLTEVEQTLVFRGKLTEQDAVDLRRYRDLLLLGKGVRRLVAVVAIGIATLGVIGMMLVGPNVTGFVLLVGTYLLLVYYPMRRLALVRRHYRKYSDQYPETTVTLSPQRVEIENSTYRSDFQWKHVGVVGDTADGLLFCNSELAPYFWLPNRLLTAEAKQLVITWSERNNVSVRRL